jgi:type VI protein secretion system component Hcp
MTNPKESSEKLDEFLGASSRELPANSSSAGGAELTEAELDKVAGGTPTHAAAPKLMQACATGVHIKEATITL